MQMSFAELGLLSRLAEDSVLSKIDRQPYGSLVMFKAVLLGQALRVRLDFIAFTHLPLAQLPDTTALHPQGTSAGSATGWTKRTSQGYCWMESTGSCNGTS